MRRFMFMSAFLLATGARAQSAGEDNLFSWTAPLWPGFWMAWTPATLAFFIFIFASIAFMGFLEWRNPGGAPRDGILGLHTTRGDRLFIWLLGSTYILLAWIGVFGSPIWGGLAITLAWGLFCFWKV